MITVISCIVNISCSGSDHHTISGSYYSNNCSQEEVASFGIQTLILNCKEDIVICNYSNPVSWKNDTIQIKQICTNEIPEENHTSSPLSWLIVILISASLLILVAAPVIYHYYKNHNNGAQQNEHTIYAQVQLNRKVQRPLDVLEKSENPQTVYGFTEEHRHPHKTAQTKSSSEIPAEKQTNNHPSTTYSTIGQHKKSFDTETDHTVYSIVCKSSNDRPPVH
ncbi:uncharacterized protein LOC113046488 [Carassius auratus]|uniref:Uncharacterized protein LOC113046488 n=1 Tax=Carassius auratus TaxID=7957 RepID=A0A6P6JTC4_CARAU|nr:uncharacterized protein LOC113046488 [Carassius auratus]